jgi:hypothetical protein
VLGSILGALKSIVAVIGMTRMTPPIKDLLPRLTPILKNRWAASQPDAQAVNRKGCCTVTSPVHPAAICLKA